MGEHFPKAGEVGVRGACIQCNISLVSSSLPVLHTMRLTEIAELAVNHHRVHTHL
jgi:hypothetical protein